MALVAEHVLRAGPPLGGVQAGELAVPALATPSDVPPLVDRVVTDPSWGFPLAEAEDLAGLGLWSVDLESGRSTSPTGLRELCGLPPDCTADPGAGHGPPRRPGAARRRSGPASTTRTRRPPRSRCGTCPASARCRSARARRSTRPATWCASSASSRTSPGSGRRRDGRARTAGCSATRSRWPGSAPGSGTPRPANASGRRCSTSCSASTRTRRSPTPNT